MLVVIHPRPRSRFAMGAFSMTASASDESAMATDRASDQSLDGAGGRTQQPRELCRKMTFSPAQCVVPGREMLVQPREQIAAK